MMQIIKPNELPEKLTPEIINILVQMAIEFPKTTFDWAETSKVLEERGQLNIILNLVDKINKEKEYNEEKKRKESLTKEEKIEDEEKWKKIFESKDPHAFHGNMGEPETPEQFKDKYGVWPPGYDKIE